MIRPVLLGSLMAGALIAMPATARDARLVQHRYNPDEVVRIEGRTGVQASIVFDEDEHIENVGIGDSMRWQVTPNKRANMLFVKPLNERARTNMTVITDRHSYYFDLVASGAANPLYVLRFTYPNQPKVAEAKEPGSPALSEPEAQAIAGPAPVEAQADPAKLNFDWVSKGKASLVPERIYDDGNDTYLAWSPDRPVPAFLIRDSKGAEGPVNFAVREGVIVIEGVPDIIVLRSGREKATLENRGVSRPASPAPAFAAVAPDAASASDPTLPEPSESQ
ncbi:MAG: TrbG/VirB9 family P-type conjugative transfer protein [Novosphingobium sp.]